MKLSGELSPHPDTPPRLVRGVAFELLPVVNPTPERRDSIWLRCKIFCREGDLALPQKVEPGRADGLWEHTCFELFVRHSERPDYLEINLSPSLQWAAYGFDGYRTGRLDLALKRPPEIHGWWKAHGYEFRCEVDLNGLARGSVADLRQVAITAVIEEADGRKSYWALAHPAGKPDFHHRDGFVLDLPLDAL